MIRTLTILIVVGCLGVGLAQPSKERLALNNITKGKFEKARGQLTKVLRKDSTSATARYVFSTFFFTHQNPSFHIDSAYRHTMLALANYESSGIKQRERMKRFPLDSAILIARREEIDSAAFVRAKNINTEKAYLYFIESFPFSRDVSRAEELRDEVAFIDALKENTYQSFLTYLNKYPNAFRAPDAKARYEKLLFETKTKDNKQASYESFLAEYPESPYRAEAEKQIFEISTASGKAKAFSDFIKRYPESHLIRKSNNILYHLLKDDEQPIPGYLLTDSIKNLRDLEQIYLVPVFKDDKFGFMNAYGKEVLKPFADEIGKEYLCGNIVEELIVGGNQIRARNGSVVFQGEIDEVDDLGYGFISVAGGKCLDVVHKSGMVMASCVDDAKLVASFIAVKKQGKWSLMTLAGRSLPMEEFSSVDAIGDVIIFGQAGKFRMYRAADVALTADQKFPELSRTADEYKRWENNLIWIRSGNSQALLNQSLSEKIALGPKEILHSFFGAISKSPNGYRLWNQTSGESKSFEDVRVQKPWIVARDEGRWNILDNNFRPTGSSSFDSITFSGPFLLGVNRDSLQIYSSLHQFVLTSASAHVQFLPGKDSIYYMLITEGEKKTVFNSAGESLFVVNFDRIDFAGENTFIIIRKDKRGLINTQGRVIVQPEYDAMGTIENGMVPVLKDKKFGFLDINRKKEIKPLYEKNLSPFSHLLLVAFKSGKYGIIDWNNKPVLPFEYEEILYWNDSTAIVKQNFQWIIYNFIEKKVVADKIKSFKWLLNSPQEKILIINQENNYGVISNRRGMLLPATYSDIVNLGTPERPLYFTEKHVEEASIYVVIYYDEYGKLLRRQVFEADDYDRIYCSQN